ncbi:hypothetical protein ACQY0O_006947 [Thecaphora frezii]
MLDLPLPALSWLALPHLVFFAYLLSPPLAHACQRSKPLRCGLTTALLALHFGWLPLAYRTPWKASDGQQTAQGNILLFSIYIAKVWESFQTLRIVARFGSRGKYTGLDGWTEEGQKPRTAAERPPLDRLRWAVGVWSSMRGVGWQRGEVDRHAWPQWPHNIATGSRSRWLGYNLVRLLRNLLVMDLLNAISQTRPSLHDSLLFYPQPLHHRAFDTLLAGYAGLLGLDTSYLFLSIVCVALGLSSHHGWRPLFGSPRHASPAVRRHGAVDWSAYLMSLSSFWGAFWHGLFRDTFVALADGVTSAFGLPATPLLQLWLAFAQSALLHSLPNCTMLHRFPWSSSAFFLLQPAGIAFERLVLRRLGLVPGSGSGQAPAPATSASASSGDAAKTRRRWQEAVGLVWVMAWLAVTGPLLMDEYVAARLFYMDSVPVSVVRPVLEAVTRSRWTRREDWMAS